MSTTSIVVAAVVFSISVVFNVFLLVLCVVAAVGYKLLIDRYFNLARDYEELDRSFDKFSDLNLLKEEANALLDSLLKVSAQEKYYGDESVQHLMAQISDFVILMQELKEEGKMGE